MSKSNTLENGYLGLILNGDPITDLAENDTTAPVTDLYLSLHTADPGEAGDQTTNECAYTGYSRQAVARSAAGFTVSGNQATLTSAVQFGECTAGSETVTHFGIGTAASGAGVLLYFGTVTPNINVTPPNNPGLSTSTTITED